MGTFLGVIGIANTGVEEADAALHEVLTEMRIELVPLAPDAPELEELLDSEYSLDRAVDGQQGVASSLRARVASWLSSLMPRPRVKSTLSRGMSDDNILTMLLSDKGHLTIDFPPFQDHFEVTEKMSMKLQHPVLSLHIHDGDLWMYTLWVNGEAVDNFNPRPDIWEDISDEEAKAQAGNTEVFCRYWPNVTPEQIEKYFVRWNWDDAGQKGKAYPDDEHEYHDDWQMLDFMRKIGLSYPDGNAGLPSSRTYRIVPPRFPRR